MYVYVRREAVVDGIDPLTHPTSLRAAVLLQVVTSTLASLSTGAKKEQLAQVEANKDGAFT